jgi:hypothetical protein
MPSLLSANVGMPQNVAWQGPPLQSRNSRHGGKRDAASVPHMHPLLSLQYRIVVMRLRRRKACLSRF